MSKQKLPVDEKFQNVDFDLFKAIEAIDRKDYSYYDNLTEEQKRKFVPFMLIQWISTVKTNKNTQEYYLRSTEYHANQHLFNENVQKHPKLQWLMLCAASPGLGKQYHHWIPNININVSKLKSMAKQKDVKDYYSKVYDVDSDTLNELTEAFMQEQHRKFKLAEMFSNLKISDIETLNSIVTDEDIKKYERDLGRD